MKHFKRFVELNTHITRDLFQPTFQKIKLEKVRRGKKNNSTFILIFDTVVGQIDLQQLVKSKKPTHILKNRRGKKRHVASGKCNGVRVYKNCKFCFML